MLADSQFIFCTVVVSFAEFKASASVLTMVSTDDNVSSILLHCVITYASYLRRVGGFATEYVYHDRHRIRVPQMGRSIYG